ncbi:MAG: sulfur carrier protein ThiS [Silicimonas sp.]|jgi:sulfur carrier protein|nr:sulfur carrier protein ThiS [Silicimonas sp.]
MIVSLNGEPRSVSGETLAEVLRECGYDGRFATAVNEVFVPAGNRGAQPILDGDRIEVLGAMQGG